jgi:hypothetical protein
MRKLKLTEKRPDKLSKLKQKNKLKLLKKLSKRKKSMRNMALSMSTILKKRTRRKLQMLMKSTPNYAKNTLSCGKKERR